MANFPPSPPSLDPPDGRPDQAPPPGYGALVRPFLLVSLLILIIEFTVMVVLEPMWGSNHLLMVFVDVGVLILMSSPAIYYLLIKPMAFQMFARADAERTVKQLEAANEFLRLDAESRIQTEAAARTRADARIQFQARILTVVQQAVIATGKGGVILYWNRYAEWIFGWTEEEVREQTLAKVTGFTPEAARSGLSGFGAVKGWSGEVKAIRRDGTTFPADMTCSPIWRTDGSVAGFAYTFLDITDRKQSEAAIRESEEKYSTVVENSPTGIFIARNGQLVFGNQRFFQMLGRSQRDLDRMNVSEMIHPDDWPRVQDLWSKRLGGMEATRNSEYRILNSEGEIRWIVGRTALIRYRGEPALLGNIQDITERHKAEQALMESREALHRLSARLMTAQENERERVARELHDSIGQSLSAVKFMVERAIEEEGSSSTSTQGKTLRSIVPVIQGSVEEVRRISMALRPTTLDDLGLLATLAWFTREFHSTYPHLAVERRIEVEEFEVPEDLKTSIFRILQEAMNNAAKYSQATVITVALRLVLGDLHLVIADNGIGFNPAEPKKGSPTGGFGLVSMRERAELSQGILILTSAPGEGTAITATWTLSDHVIS